MSAASISDISGGDLSPDSIDARAILDVATRAARAAERANTSAEDASEKAAEAVRRSEAAFDESRRARVEVRAVRKEQVALGAAMAENQAALLVALAQLATTAQVQETISAQARKAQFDADAARRDKADADAKSEEVTGRYDVKELLRQSQSDNEDAKIVRRLAVTVIDQDEKDRAEAAVERKRRSVTTWKIVREISVVVIAVASSFVAAKYGIHLAH